MFFRVEFNNGGILEVFALNEEQAMDVAEYEMNEHHNKGEMLVPVAVERSERESALLV